MDRNANIRTTWIFSIGLMGAASATLVAGPPVSTWTNEWQPDPPSWAIGDLTAVGSDGSVYVTARPDDGTGQGNALAILKYDADGTLKWQVVRNGVGVGSEGITDLEVTPEGVAAIAISQGATGPHPLILDYASDGTLRWDDALPGPVSGGFLVPQITVAHDGQRIVAFDDGETGSLRRYTSDGTLINAVPLSFSGFGGVSALGVDDDLNAIVVAVNDFSTYDITKFDPAGNELWSYSDLGIGLVLSEAFLAIDANGDVMVAGSLEVECVPDGITVNSRVWRLDSDGGLLWSLDLPDNGCEFRISTDLTIGFDGEAYLTGVAYVGAPAVLTRIDSDGTEAWSASHSDGEIATTFSDVAVGTCGDVYVGGRDTNGVDFLEPRVVSFSPNGELQWTGQVGDETMFLADLATGNDGSVTVVGTRRPAPSGIDDRATTVRLAFAAGQPGDLDCDGAVSLFDFGIFEGCMTGPGLPHPVGCDSGDFNGDGDVDFHDFAEFQKLFPGLLP